MVTARTPRFFDGILALTPLRFFLWITVIAALCPGLFTDAFKLLPFMDDHQFHSWEEADRLSLLRYGQLPLWNPFYCGGMVGTAAPESGTFAPDFVLRLLFGVAHGRRLAVVLFLGLGMEGTYRLCRSIDGSALASVFASVVFSTSTLLLHTYLGMGWVNFFGFELVPWVVLALFEGNKSVAWRLGGACALAWIALAAGTYTAPYTAIAIGLLTASMCLREALRGTPREIRGWLLSASTIGAGALVLASAKLVPMVLVMRQYPRVFTPSETNEAFALLRGYGVAYGVVLLIAIFALFFADFWARLFVAMAIAFFLLAMGQFADWAPSSLMKKLPLVSGLRFPDRFMVMFHLFAVLAAARGLTKIEDGITAVATRIWSRVRPAGKRAALESRLGPVILTALAAGALFYVGRSPLEGITSWSKIPAHSLYTLDPPRVAEESFRQHRGNRRDAHVFPAVNRGSLYCFVGIPIPESARLRADLPAEEYPADPTIASVERVSWTPNEIVLKVDAKAKTRFFVNQNYNPHWTTDVGEIIDDQQLLAVDVPEGMHLVTLRYRDWLAVACVVLSLSALLAIAVFFAKLGFTPLRATFSRWIEVDPETTSNDAAVDARTRKDTSEEGES